MAKNHSDLSAKYSAEELAIGSVFKLLRESKGFSQEETAGDEISCPQLSNFENGKTILVTHHFMALLRNINVDMFEFQNAYNQYLKNKDILLFSVELSNAVMDKDTSKLNLYLKQIEAQLTLDSQNKRLKLDAIRIKSLLYFVDQSNTITKNEQSFLINYLFDLKEWSMYDIRLLGSCAQFIDVIKLAELTNHMIDPLQTNIELYHIKHAITQCLLNIINIFVEQKIFEPARRLIAYLENSEIHEYFMFDKLTLIYNSANYSHQKGDSDALVIMEKCLKILEFCGCSKTATQVSEELKKLKKNPS
ncbi:Rgg/GadR/MutR family transcriptional regulator [Lactococcus lactis]|uniref:Rgg/GadR/MutR family transcriptional regulator n=1 Tax=Lactococcus lactis TaxID=1358 RepID=UPI0018C7D598|nr:Rgg/GadR/MutR family transcriptional regulator [Lactococcus lactis]MBG1279090.1 hypothetical protein [Lactococcus lactis subsp. lactis]